MSPRYEGKPTIGRSPRCSRHAEHKPIGGSFDGQSFYLDFPGEAAHKVAELGRAEYRLPADLETVLRAEAVR